MAAYIVTLKAGNVNKRVVIADENEAYAKYDLFCLYGMVIGTFVVSIVDAWDNTPMQRMSRG